ncbi:MAG: antibiotic biosynthesis monooxygenase family protein [bacterium]
MAKNMIVEWAPFELAEGFDEKTLLQASEELPKEFSSKQKGFIWRELLKGKNNQWVDLAYWKSREDAEQAVKNAAKSLVGRGYFQCMLAADHDDPGAGVLHLERIETYNA